LIGGLLSPIKNSPLRALRDSVVKSYSGVELGFSIDQGQDLHDSDIETNPGQREFEVSVQEGSTVRNLLSWMTERWGDKLSPHLFQPESDRVLFTSGYWSTAGTSSSSTAWTLSCMTEMNFPFSPSSPAADQKPGSKHAVRNSE